MQTSKAFGIVLKNARIAANFSQADLAAKSGYDVTFISRLERGLQNPTIKTLFDLAKVLKLSPVELIHRTELQLLTD